MPPRAPSSIGFSRVLGVSEITDSEFEQFRLGLEKATGVPIRLRVTVVKAALAEFGPETKSEANEVEKRAAETEGD